MKLWLLTSNHQEWLIFGVVFRYASRLGADKILSILCRANPPDITKDLRKVLLGLEAAGDGDVQHSRFGSAQHPFSTIEPLAQNKLMRGLAGRLAKHPREMGCAQAHRLRHLVETQVFFHLRVD